MIGPYANTPGARDTVLTPNMDRLMERGVVFDNHFIGSAPCMPARRELMTGRKEFLWRGWGPMEPFDEHIASRASAAGAVTAMVTDHYHYWEYPAHGYLERFDGVTMIRGHEMDILNTDKLPGEGLPGWVEQIERWRPGLGARYYRNVKQFGGEEDFFAPKTFSAACDWLDGNHGHPKFLLWTECFDVHEPFHVPEPYRSMFTDKDPDKYNCWPPYQEGFHGHTAEWWAQADSDQIDFVRSQYKGKLAMADAHLGKLLDRMDKYDLWENTVLILTTDHGHELGEKERFGKQSPHYDLSANIPLIVCAPGVKPARVSALTTAVDIYPTVLEVLDADSAAPHGRSLLPLVRGESGGEREAVVYGTFGCGATLTDGNYTYHTGWDADRELNQYTAFMLDPAPGAVGGRFIPGVGCPVWKIPRASAAPVAELLFNRVNDPAQDENVLSERPDIRERMRALLRHEMEREGVPDEQYDRLNLR